MSSTLPDFKGTGTKIQQRLSTLETNALTKEEAQSQYLGKDASIPLATKALQDGEGNVISETYAKKVENLNIKIGAEDLVAGESELSAGTLYFVYE